MEPETDKSRKQTGATGTDVFINATDEKLLFTGRSRVVDTTREFDWPCSSFRFVVTGPAKEVWVEMGCRIGAHNNELAQCKNNAYPGAGALMKSYVDGKPIRRVVVYEGAAQYLMAENLESGEHVIHVSKCSEFCFGMVLVKGVVVPENCSVKAASPKKVIEVIGDSNSCQPGGVGPFSYDEGAMNKYMMSYTDTDLSWSSNVCAAFDIDQHLIACSGIGFMANAMKIPHGPMLDVYTRVCENETEVLKALPPVDLSIIFLGANDWVAGGMAGKDQQAIEGYKKLIDLVRSLRPSTPILCLYPNHCSLGAGPHLESWSRMMQKGFHVNMAKWVKGAAKLAGGDSAKVYARMVVPTPQISGGGDEDFGLMAHHNIEGGKKFASGVIPLVAEVTGWTPVGTKTQGPQVTPPVTQSTTVPGTA
eukprot:gene25063-30577_t